MSRRLLFWVVVPHLLFFAFMLSPLHHPSTSHKLTIQTVHLQPPAVQQAPPQKKEPVRKKASSPQKTQPDRQAQRLAREAEANIEKIGRRDNNRPLKKSKRSQEPFSYREVLVSKLKLLLQLPEYGEVKVALTLNKIGRVTKLTILESHNTRNRQFVEETMPHLTFPPLGPAFPGEEEHTFTLTLQNQ